MSARHRGRAELNKQRTETANTHRQARHEAEQANIGALAQCAQLDEYEQNVLFRKKGATADPDAKRALSIALARQILEDPDLVFTAIGGARLRLEDLGPARRLREAATAAQDASRAYSDFCREHEAEFIAEQKAAEQEALKAALAAGDKDSLRDILGMNEKATDSLTTADLAG